MLERIRKLLVWILKFDRPTKTDLTIMRTIGDTEMTNLTIFKTTGVGAEIYLALDKLEDLGFVSSRWEECEPDDVRGGGRRRYYRLTDAGLEKLRRVCNG